jgi:lysophospholipase L1-like esterase
MRTPVIIILCSVLFIVACKKTSTESQKDSNNWGSADFTMFVSLGNSLTAGVANGGLYEGMQKKSFPNLIAGQAGIDDFEQPIMTGNGYSWKETDGRLSVGTDLTISFLSPGNEGNRSLSRPFNNLGVPLITAEQMLTVTNSVAADSNHFVDKILRNSGRTLIEEALALSPTMITLWVGNNDLLEAASLGLASAESPYTPVEDFQGFLEDIIDQLKNGTDAPIFIGNVVDFTTLPYFTSLPSYVIDSESGEKTYLTGICEDGARELTDDDLLLYWALPNYVAILENEMPVETVLNDTLILDASEKNEIRNLIGDYNDVINHSAGFFNNVHHVDIHQLFVNINTSGYNFGDINYTTDLITFNQDGSIQLNLTQTLFSFDGLHPIGIGYAAIANAFIERINAVLNSQLDLVTPADL